MICLACKLTMCAGAWSLIGIQNKHKSRFFALSKKQFPFFGKPNSLTCLVQLGNSFGYWGVSSPGRNQLQQMFLPDVLYYYNCLDTLLVNCFYMTQHKPSVFTPSPSTKIFPYGYRATFNPPSMEYHLNCHWRLHTLLFSHFNLEYVINSQGPNLLFAFLSL